MNIIKAPDAVWNATLCYVDKRMTHGLIRVTASAVAVFMCTTLPSLTRKQVREREIYTTTNLAFPFTMQ